MELAASPVCFDDPTGAFSPARPPAFRFPPGLPRPAPVPTAPSFVGTFPISPAGKRCYSYCSFRSSVSLVILIGRLLMQARWSTVSRTARMTAESRGKRSPVREQCCLARKLASPIFLVLSPIRHKSWPVVGPYWGYAPVRGRVAFTWGQSVGMGGSDKINCSCGRLLTVH